MKATVASATRRYIEICSEKREFLLAKPASRALDAVVGDSVEYQEFKNEFIVESIAPRKNIIKRSYLKKQKELVANVDHLFIVTAVGPLYNPVFVDRVLAVAISQNVPCSIIINKVDLPNSNLPLIRRTYGPEVIETSILNLTSLDPLKSKIRHHRYKIIAFTGVSGVGKSSLINLLIPNASVRTQQVSKRTGQGKQTTTQSFAYLYEDRDLNGFLVDMPGIQSFGVAHLSEDEAKVSFPEFINLSRECKYSNCMHLEEVNCGVKNALSDGRIVSSRYDSYCDMITEIRAHKNHWE